MKLEGKDALVTGASRGIGRAVAFHLATAGAFVYVNYSTSEAEADKTVALIEEQGGRAEKVKCDVASPNDVEGAIKRILDAKGKIDILVNNAGISRDTLLMRVKEEDYHAVFDINVKGVLICTRAVIKSMIKNRSGRVVNISSVVGEMGNAGQSVYSASKAGIIGFTKSIAREVAPRGITVNVVSPGFIVTDMTDGLPDSQKEAYLKDIPLGRFGDPEDVARMVLFLCTDHSSYITGQVFRVNGGMYM
ncbi:MAG: 3-oxoacyl-[acyl-carrier-protein] reductase [Deltaproteobacteria bacterium]|nr:3-oxoacyl-[acyl-carrier-protein] reductase [Deltaproteobacteria bacterium]